jgi:hypothetical protein
MKHKKIEKLIQKLLDREANTDEQKSLQYHLSQCEECRQFYQEMVKTEQALGGLTEVYPQPGFNDRILKGLGFRRRVLWKRVAPVFAGAWIASVLVVLLSPWPGLILNHLLTAVPAAVRLLDKGGLIVTSMSHMLMPFAKGSVTAVYPILGLILSILMFYFLGKTLQKEAKCKA